MKKILLIDGNSILNRAFYGIPLLENDQGVYTNGIYGFLNMLFRFLEDEKPSNLIIAFDVKGKNFRHNMYKEYKGTRKGMPEELKGQFPILKKILEVMKIKMVEEAGFEADDVIGTLSKKFEEKKYEVVVISGDKDLLQLASKKIKIKIPKTKKGKTETEVYFEKDVIEKIGVTPTEFIDVKALMGDPSDNIPGIPGIGEKTALKIIKEYKNIESAIENIDDIKPKKAQENLREFKELAITSKKLATIILNMEIDIKEEETLIGDIFNDKAYQEIEKLQLKSLYKKFRSTEEVININCITNPFEVEELVIEILKKDLVAYNFMYDEEKISGISFTYEKNKSEIILVDEYFTEEKIINTFKVFFESDVKKISEDKKRDKKHLNKFNTNINNIVFDISLGSYLDNPTKKSYVIDDISFTYLNKMLTSIEELVGKGRNKITFEEVEIEKKKQYLGKLSNILFEVYPILKDKLKNNDMESLYFDIEMPLEEILLDIESRGIYVDKEILKKQGVKLTKRINELEIEIINLAGTEFNINSPKQLGEVLFEKLGLKGGKKTKTGFSTSVEVLEKLKKVHPIVNLVLEYRVITKLLSTYIEGLQKEINSKTNKIHSTFTQKITATGRLSSIEPNLQNIPIRTEQGRDIRKAFTPLNRETHIFISADYSQIELRILAHLSEDETLINAYKEDADIHKLTASQVFNKKYDEVTDEERSNAKAVNFGIIYGISSFSLSQDLYITKKEADRYIESYFNTYPKIKIFLDKSIEETRERGYAKTLFNRRRSVPEITSSNFIKKGFGERIAMNMPIQGTAADIIKIAMIKVYNRLLKDGLESKIILQIHDELLLEVKKEEKDLVKTILIEEMSKAVEFKVDLDISISEGSNWYEAK